MDKKGALFILLGFASAFLKNSDFSRQNSQLPFTPFALAIFRDKDPTRGCYFALMKMGSPPRKVAVLVDSGSYQLVIKAEALSSSSTLRLANEGEDLLGRPCKSFETHNSGPGCFFQISYSDASQYKGQYALDTLHLPRAAEKASYPQSFARVTESLHDTLLRVGHGVLGLRPRDQHGDYPPTFLEGLFGQAPPLYSVCINQRNGRISFGRANTELHLPGAQTVVLRSESTTPNNEFVMKVSRIEVDGVTVLHCPQPVKGMSRNAVFDFGASASSFPAQAYRALERGFATFCTRAPANCAGTDGFKWSYALPSGNMSAVMAGFPLITFHFHEKSKFVLHPRNYLDVRADGIYTNFVTMDWSSQADSQFAESDHFSFGATFMRGHDVTFDFQRKELRLTRANCRSLPPSQY